MKPRRDFVWIGRKEDCGCVVAVATDSDRLKERASMVKDIIMTGAIPERIPWAKYLEIAESQVFMNFPHKIPEVPKGQQALFEEKS